MPNEQDLDDESIELTDEERELLGLFVDLINSNDLIAELRPDGLVGWRVSELPADDHARLCRLCQGAGFLSPAIANIVTADFRLQNLCPDCHGTGINEAVNEVTPTEPLPYRFDPESIDEVPF